jgi:CRISPR-associated protein Cas2
MWIMVMFDLPVDTPIDRREAADFRNRLKDMGFEMAQYSVYLKYTSGQSECDAITERVRGLLPSGGRVYVHCLTDRQYEKIVRFEKRKRIDSPQNPKQYELF